jgi:Protein of unknwon function (DUF3310)
MDNEKDYYKTPSPIGKSILDLFLHESCYKEDCIHTLWHLEELGAKFNTLNAIKYLWRLGVKDPDYREDLKKAIQYLDWERATILYLVNDLNNEIESSKLGVERLLLNAALALDRAETSIATIDKTIAACKSAIAEYESGLKL